MVDAWERSRYYPLVSGSGWLQITPRTFHHASTSTSPSPPAFCLQLWHGIPPLHYTRVNSSVRFYFLFSSFHNFPCNCHKIPIPRFSQQYSPYTLYLASQTLVPPRTSLAMSQSLLNPSPLKEGRRILSEKSANACLSPARSPAKQMPFNSPPPKKLLPSPSFVAQKRSISQLDAENVESRLPVQGQCVEARQAQHEASARSIADLDNRVRSYLQTIEAKYSDTHVPNLLPFDSCCS